MDYKNKLAKDFINSLIGKKVSVELFVNPDLDRYSFTGILTDFNGNCILVGQHGNIVLIDLDSVVAIMGGWLE